jgi:hypothetical protein
VFDDATPQIVFYINGTLVATITTNRPLANTGMGIEFSAAEPSTFANPIIYIAAVAAQCDF